MPKLIFSELDVISVTSHCANKTPAHGSKPMYCSLTSLDYKSGTEARKTCIIFHLLKIRLFHSKGDEKATNKVFESAKIYLAALKC